MNKAKMAQDLREWISIGSGLPELIIDSPHQNKDYAPYVVELLVKKTPIKQIPFLVLEQLESEVIKQCEPKKGFFQKWLKLKQ